jgi:uncharacterized protein YyaL (SSP411 family)
MQKVMPLIVMLCVSVAATAQRKQTDLWQSWQEVVAASANTNKPIFIDVYTDWCRYCRIMDATTYRNDSVVDYLRKHFLRFKFNAETRDTINWNGQTFRFNPRYDAHDFAVYLTHGSIAYPTAVIITPGGQPFYKPGEIKPAEMEMLLKYFVENKGKLSLVAYAQTFVSSWR